MRPVLFLLYKIHIDRYIFEHIVSCLESAGVVVLKRNLQHLLKAMVSNQVRYVISFSDTDELPAITLIQSPTSKMALRVNHL